MSYIPSVNIELNSADDFRYIVTENAKLVAGTIVSNYNSGNHSFTIIGTYGTGKSSFILALEDDLRNKYGRIVKSNVLGHYKDFEFLNIVGDYISLNKLLSQKLNSHECNAIDALRRYYEGLRKQNKFLVIVIDEFGKILEYAANNNPEQELYYLQKLAEFVNTPSRSIMLLTTLHQNFGSYAHKLSEPQKNEWHKVKGRFQEIVFAEPVEQLLTLTAQQLEQVRHIPDEANAGFHLLHNLGQQSKVVTRNFEYATSSKLYPLDPISAVCLTKAMQKYGQNERTLFSFLSAQGQGTINDFETRESTTYNVASLYDYLSYYFYSSINQANSDSMKWRSITVAIERIEGSDLDDEEIEECKKLIKTIGLLNIFFNGIVLDEKFIKIYGANALGISNPEHILKEIIRMKVVRYANYKSQYILYEGTNIDIENELYKASVIVPTPILSVEEIAPYIRQKAALAYAAYYKTGSPRYFEYRVLNEPTILEPTGDTDGHIELIFPLSDIEDKIVELSNTKNCGATIFGYFKNTEKITKHLHEIKKLQYLIDNIAFDDRIARSELDNQKAFEIQSLNDVINNSIQCESDSVAWYFHGERFPITTIRDFNKMLSTVCEIVYNKTPIIRNELFNRQKLSSAISLARVNLLDKMLANSDKEDFGIEGFPPEKTIYYTIFKDSGIHRQNEEGIWMLDTPTSENLQSLWDVSIKFLNSTTDKPKKLTELVKILKSAPYKLKQGVIDYWIPIFLYINQQNFALYNSGVFVLNINKEVFELLQKRLVDFSVKAFYVDGIKMEFFKRYRQFLRKDETIGVTSASLMETVKPFFHFYRNLNNYAKRTQKFDSPYTSKFRDVLSDAIDPVKTFFEDLPQALGYTDLKSDEFTGQYLDLIRRSVRELNICYDNLIGRIEERIISHLGLDKEFDVYKPILEERYRSIDARILTPKTRAFLDRVLAPSESKKEFIEKIAIVISDKRLDETSDAEEPMLIHSILHSFSELERYSSIALDQSENEETEAFNFELATSDGRFSQSQTYRLPKSKSNIADNAIARISSILTEDEELNICILLKLLNQRLK